MHIMLAGFEAKKYQHISALVHKFKPFETTSPRAAFWSEVAIPIFSFPLFPRLLTIVETLFTYAYHDNI